MMVRRTELDAPARTTFFSALMHSAHFRSMKGYRDKETKERGKAEKRLCALARLSGFRHTFLNDGYKDRTGRASAHHIFFAR
jgi:hypothetical protein